MYSASVVPRSLDLAVRAVTSTMQEKPMAGMVEVDCKAVIVAALKNKKQVLIAFSLVIYRRNSVSKVSECT